MLSKKNDVEKYCRKIMSTCRKRKNDGEKGRMLENEGEWCRIMMNSVEV